MDVLLIIISLGFLALGIILFVSTYQLLRIQSKIQHSTYELVMTYREMLELQFGLIKNNSDTIDLLADFVGLKEANKEESK